jgi:hypothetical protein
MAKMVPNIRTKRGRTLGEMGRQIALRGSLTFLGKFTGTMFRKTTMFMLGISIAKKVSYPMWILSSTVKMLPTIVKNS